MGTSLVFDVRLLVPKIDGYTLSKMWGRIVVADDLESMSENEVINSDDPSHWISFSNVGVLTPLHYEEEVAADTPGSG